MRTLLGAVAVVSMGFTLASAQSGIQSGSGARVVPVQMVVTAEPLQGSAVPQVGREDVRVLQSGTNVPVTEWVPLQGDMAGLELYVLIDERVDPAATARFDELRHFISSQAVNTAVGVAYMDNGVATIVQVPTKDHARAARAVRLPTGDNSAEANPFTSLSMLIYGWSPGAPRREVLLVTDGIDVFEDVEGASPYLDIAVMDAQSAGVPVFCLFAPSAGHAGHSPALIHGGQAYLAQLAEETGGEAYFEQGGGPAPSFNPYLADVAKHLSHQYQVTFLAAPLAGNVTPVTGKEFQRVAFRTQLSNVEMISAHGFYLKAEERDKR